METDLRGTEFHLLDLHGALVEGDDPRPEHPHFEVYDFPGGIAAFRESEFEVWAQHRPRGAEPDRSADRVVAEIRCLLARGVSPSRIGGVGHSKGGSIALFASARLGAPEVAWIRVQE